ncbi:unnamed protein product, partial [Rotaria magnacalcarata]
QIDLIQYEIKLI